VGEISTNFDLKNMIFDLYKEFLMGKKNHPNLQNFEEQFQIA
jgi:hypothetical protein